MKQGSSTIEFPLVDKQAYQKINTILFDSEIGLAYCKGMEEQGRCPRLKGHTCQNCVATLKVLLEQDWSWADNKRAASIWTLQEYLKDRSFIRSSSAQKRRKFNTNRPQNASELIQNIFNS
jgi:hypothetical protein